MAGHRARITSAAAFVVGCAGRQPGRSAVGRRQQWRVGLPGWTARRTRRAFVVARGVPEAELVAADATMRFDRETGTEPPTISPHALPEGLAPLVVVRSLRVGTEKELADLGHARRSKEPTGEDAGGPPDSLVVSAVRGDLR